MAGVAFDGDGEGLLLMHSTTAGCRVDATTRFRPRNRRGSAGVEPIEQLANLYGPGRFSVGIDLGFETLDQFASERSGVTSPDDLTVARGLLSVARALANRPVGETSGLWPRASALLARQSLEVALATYWSAVAPGTGRPGGRSCSKPTCLPQPLARRISAGPR
jgi:hypothetical protein